MTEMPTDVSLCSIHALLSATLMLCWGHGGNWRGCKCQAEDVPEGTIFECPSKILLPLCAPPEAVPDLTLTHPPALENPIAGEPPPVFPHFSPWPSGSFHGAIRNVPRGPDEFTKLHGHPLGEL